MKNELEKDGHKVKRVLCPEKVFTSSKEEKVYKLNIEHGEAYDLVMELHLNSSDNKTANGTEVLYVSENGKKYAESIEKQLATVFRDRGAKRRTDLYILNQTTKIVSDIIKDIKKRVDSDQTDNPDKKELK